MFVTKSYLIPVICEIVDCI